MIPITRDGRRWARAERLRRDTKNMSDTFPVRKKDNRWAGHAVEYELHSYLRRLGIPHKWNGGIDNKPDFEIHGHAADVKTTVGRMDGRGVTIPYQFFGRLSPFVIACVADITEMEIHVLGVGLRLDVQRDGEMIHKGDRWPNGAEVRNTCIVVRMGHGLKWDLEGWLDWLSSGEEKTE